MMRCEDHLSFSKELLPLVIKFYTPLPGDLNVKMLNIRDLVAPFNVVVFVKTVSPVWVWLEGCGQRVGVA